MSAHQVGDRINNYILERQLGVGSFGEVWKAKHHIFDEWVAVKIPTDPQYVRNLQREGVAVHGLRHDNIVRALDLDPYASPPYLIMEYIEGPTLRKLIDDYPGGLPVQSSLNIFRGLLTALAAAHQAGVIHRDVKPANILIKQPGGEVTEIRPQDVKVTDFGLGAVSGITTASIMQSGSLQTDEGRSISGTLAYMSPEQRDGGKIDQRSDLYACGLVLFEMCTGLRPQGSDLPSDLRPQVPSIIDDIFGKCYTRLERRYPSAGAILADLDDLAEHPAPKATGIPAVKWQTTEPRCRRCSSAVSKLDQFCIHCGQQLVDVIPRCPSCRAYVDRADNYCIECGTALGRQDDDWAHADLADSRESEHDG